MYWLSPAAVKTMLPCVLLSALLLGCGGGGGGGSGTTAGTSTATSTAADVTLAPTPTPTPVAAVPQLTVRAYAMLAANVGAMMSVRINGVTIGTVEVRSTTLNDYVFNAPTLTGGATVEVVYTNDEAINGEDRNLIVAYITDGTTTVVPSQPGVVLDYGAGNAAFDGLNTVAGQEVLFGNGALRVAWPAAAANNARALEASRFLQQATFGPTVGELGRLQTLSYTNWLDDQMSMPAKPDFVNYIQSKYDQGPDFRPPLGSKYTPETLENAFWLSAAASPDQLRKRVGFALHEIFVASQTDSNLYYHSRAYANYLDTLNQYAFGNFRTLIEEIALSPVMGTYLSHLRNQKEDPTTNRLPDENFARELMQLFTIGLYELNIDGSNKLNAQGLPIETYSNDDVMALAKVFTGWSWGFDDAQLSTYNFFYGWPDYATTGTARVDLRRMKAYPGMSSTAEKRLFSGTSNAVVIAAGAPAADGLRLALDALFNHPNVGPFIGRQLIQRLVTSNPSPAYVSRVAQAFNNNGAGVRGDLGAVVRAILLDTEARSAPGSSTGKIREPILRVTHWMRTFSATSVTGEYTMPRELVELGQQALHAPSVFNYFRPGYTPANTTLASPEMQIIDEATTANWINLVERMLNEGLGWAGPVRDVRSTLSTEKQLIATSPDALLDHLNLMLFSGQMSTALRRNLLDAMAGVDRGSANRDDTRVKVAIYLAMSSPEYLVQR